ncbi:MAG: dimethylarginine dimethylaminohydrolase family protein, partial [Thermomicrobiales bacterium]
ATLIEQSTVSTDRAWGGQSMVAPLRRVLARRPATPVTSEEFARFGYPDAVDHARAEREHEAFRALLADVGADVVVAGPDEAGLLDAIFAYDPSLITDAGAVLLRPGKDLRLPEVALAERAYAELGIPIAGRIEAPGTVEGGDTLWLDERTLAVGRGYRTNDEGIRQLRAILELSGIRMLTVDLPHWQGSGECLHLMSLMSPVAERLAVVYLPLMSVSFVEELRRRGWSFIEVPDEEFETLGCNVLTLAPKRVLVCDGSPVVRERLEVAGCAVVAYEGREISHNRAGGPTCLTRPILRA